MTQIVLWSDLFDESAEFYRALLEGEIRNASESFVEVCADNACVMLHRVPVEWVSEISNPPAVREENPIKPVFTVVSIANSRDSVAGGRGSVRPIDTEFVHGEWLFCDAIDPDGNVVQLRQQA